MAHNQAEFNDLKADLKALPVMAETVGRVHIGFKTEVDDLWPMIEEDINRKAKCYLKHFGLQDIA